MKNFWENLLMSLGCCTLFAACIIIGAIALVCFVFACIAVVKLFCTTWMLVVIIAAVIVVALAMAIWVSIEDYRKQKQSS